jgi:TonB family protein
MQRIRVLILLLVAFVPILAAPLENDSLIVILAEYKLRARVVKSVVPSFPEKALSAGSQGLVIAAVHFDEDGNFRSALVLKSPHPEISSAVTKALEDWKVTPYLVGKVVPTRIQSELRFYYVIEDGVGRVDAPSLEEQRKPSRESRKIDAQFRRTW